MIYGYIRVSTDKQDTENQKFEISGFAARQGFGIDGWVDETVSGAKDYRRRALFPLLKRLKRGDRIVCAELSRLGRELMMIMEILRFCLETGVEVWTVKDNYRLGDDISSKVLAFAFGLSAEIERKLIGQRTKAALDRLKAEGVHVGRPKGRKSSHVKLTGKEDMIRSCLEAGFSKSAIARKLRVDRVTLGRYMVTHMGFPYQNYLKNYRVNPEDYPTEKEVKK